MLIFGANYPTENPSRCGLFNVVSGPGQAPWSNPYTGVSRELGVADHQRQARHGYFEAAASAAISSMSDGRRTAFRLAMVAAACRRWHVINFGQRTRNLFDSRAVAEMLAGALGRPDS